MPDPAWLCSAEAIRATCNGLVRSGETAAFEVVEDRLTHAADYVARVIRRKYPSLDIPHHARWRHYRAGGVNRWAALRARLTTEPAELARTRIDLCVTSVLLDAGAGPDWRYAGLSRSEGLAAASLDAFAAGLFASDGSPRADAAGLGNVTAEALGRAFRVSEDNPLTGLDGRAALLRALGAAVLARPDLFPNGRVGTLFDTLLPLPRAGEGRGEGDATRLPAATILSALLDGLGPIWPGRPLGDVWPHPAAPGGYVAFHKLSQWLAYSLIEVFEDAGVPVTGVDALTGLPEYRNGGLLIDTGVLRPTFASRPLDVGDPEVVEWRALTVVLLDRLAPMINERLGRTLPLSRLLEGGTWAAGRAIAAERRPGGAPPLAIVSDGTVF